jgi:cysteine desulfurase/selenocysteine lyase
MRSLDVDKIRRDFPILRTKMNGKPLVYLDNAATSQKPESVIDAISSYYRTYNANIHRGIYKIAEEATEKYTESKEKLAKFINAGSMQEIIYVRNTTEAINLAALSWGEANIEKRDHILISRMEHHSNMVPWMVLAKKKKAVLDYIELAEDNAKLSMRSFEEQLKKMPKILAVTHASNVLGTINDVKTLTRRAHRMGTKVVIDGAQSTPHMKVDVRDIDCDFFALSGHKMLGPTGIGALYAKSELLEAMEPLITGGDMIKSVTYDSYSWNDIPWKFEAGTSDIAGGIGLGAALNYLNKIGIDKIREHEKKITKYALEVLGGIKNVETFGLGAKDLDNRGGTIAFAVKGVHPHDVAQIFDSEGIAIRAGQHCAMPLVTERLGENALSRISFYLYNKESEVDMAAEAIEKTKRIFKIG